MQPRAEIEKHYEHPDPWQYQSTADDAQRKRIIIEQARRFCPYHSRIYDVALDIGCGEAWITQDLPALERLGYELSDNAAARFPGNVKRVTGPARADLVVTTGTLYGHYDWPRMIYILNGSARGIILTCNIAAWENQEAIGRISAKQIHVMEFPYREFMQRLRVFSV